MQITLDHLILRTADPRQALARLEGLGLPVLEPVERVGPAESGIVRAGAIDIEALRIGAQAPEQPVGHGLGLTADVGLREIASELRRRGLATSMPIAGSAGTGATRRTWRVIHVHGLLPEPFPAPVSARPPGRGERLLGAAVNAAARLPGIAAAGARRAGRSMVVVTSYDFDAQAWRARAAGGPQAVEVHVGVAGHEAAWERLGPIAGPTLCLNASDAGVERIVLRGEGWGPERRETVGAVALAGSA